MMSMRSISRLSILGIVLLGMLLSFAPSQGFAQVLPNPAGTCTTDPQFNPPAPTPGNGVISSIVTYVKLYLNGLDQYLFSIVQSNLATTAYAALVVYLIVYAVLFTFGMIQVSLHDLVVRMLKVGVILWLFNPSGGWDFFNNYVIYFFNEGTDALITAVSSITVYDTNGTAMATGYDPNAGGMGPFDIMDSALTKAFSAKMIVTFSAIIFTGYYGILFGLLLLLAMGSFVRALLMVVWVYLMSITLKALLFGIAPIFITCLLFDRTKYLFNGWLNQLLNACLQPIFVFIFFAFFAGMVEACIDNILRVPVCWTEAKDSVRGTPFHLYLWRFEIPGPSGWEPYGGSWGYFGTPATGFARFPFDIINVLLFVVLAELAIRFNNVVLMIAGDLASASTNLGTFEGALSEWFSNAKNTINRGKPGPGGTLAVGGGRGGFSSGKLSAEAAALKNVRDQIKSKGVVKTIQDNISDMSSRRR